MSDSSKAVFLSYASQDAEAAKKICEALRAVGVEVWFDQSELVGGDSWDAKIRGQIGSCALFVPLISAATQARLEGYFRLEWKLAAQRTHTMADEKTFLLPVVIDATRDAEAKVPAEFKTVQWTKLPGSETPERFCTRVKALLGGSAIDVGPVADRAPGPRPGQQQTRPSSRSWSVPAIVGVGLLVAIAAFFALRPRRSPEEIAKLLASAQSAAANAAAKSAPTLITDPTGPAAASAPLSESRKLTLKARALVDDDLMAARENFRLAEELCQRAVTLAPDDGEAWATLGRVSCEIMARNYEMTTHRREVARSAAERAVRLAPESVEAGLAEAAYLDLTGELVAAEAGLRRLLSLAANDERVALAYARELQRVSGRDAAEEFWRTHPALAGNSARMLATHAYALRTPGNFARAQELVERAQAIAPSRTGFLTKLLLLVIDYADLDGAKSFTERLPPQLAQEDIFASLISRAWMRLGDGPRALALLNRVPQDFFEEVRRVEPKGYLMGRALELSGKAIAAEAEWKSALAVVERRLVAEPNRPPYLRAKAVLQALTHQSDEAERTWRLYAEVLGARRPLDLLEMNLTHSEILLAANRLEDAIAGLLAEKGWSDSPDPSPVTSLHYDPWFAPLRKDARVQALIESCEASRDQQLGRARTPAVSVLPATAKADDKSVAVLAFADLSAARDSEYFSDGISEELLNVLAKVPGLKVTARTSAFFFKGKNLPIPEIASKLGVAYVIEGSVQRAGERVKITAQLIKAADGFHVWSDTFTRDAKDVFAVEEEIAGLIAKQLSLKLGVSSAAATASVNPQAFELYLQAREGWRSRTPAGLTRAEELLNRALALEPNFARAHAALADVWLVQGQNADTISRFDQRDGPAQRRVVAKAQQAIALDPESAEAHSSLGACWWIGWKRTEAEGELRRALALNSNYASAHHFLARVLMDEGRVDESLAEFKLAVEHDPLSSRIADNYGEALANAGKYHEALTMIERAHQLQPENAQADYFRASLLIAMGRVDEGVAIVRDWPEDDGDARFPKAIVLALAGQREKARALLADPKLQKFVDPLNWFFLESPAQAFTKLDPAKAHSIFVNNWLFAPNLDLFRADPRFVKYIETIGLTEAHARAQAWRQAHPPEKPAAK